MNEEPHTNEGASGLKDRVREQASTVASGAKEKVSAAYSTKKDSIVGDIENLASTLRRAGQEMSGSPLSRLADTVADQLDSAGRVVGGKDLDTIIRDVEQFAKRNPAAFLSGAAAVGFMAARFVKSSARQASGGSTSAVTSRSSLASSGSSSGSGYATQSGSDLRSGVSADTDFATGMSSGTSTTGSVGRTGSITNSGTSGTRGTSGTSSPSGTRSGGNGGKNRGGNGL